MKIKTLCRRACRTASKLIIFKSLLISVAIMCACLILARNADALGVQIQWGFGDDSDFTEFGMSYERKNLNLFLHDSELFDVFIGFENASSKHRPDLEIVVSSYEYKAAVLGLRVKPLERRGVNPYLVLGVLNGNVRYSAYANGHYDMISQSRDDASFTSYRAGFGLNIINIDIASSKLEIEVEANYSGGVPAAYATVTDRWGAAGNRSDMVMFDRSPIVNIAVGVHYSF